MPGGARRLPSARFFRDLLEGSALLFLQQLRVNAGGLSARGDHCCRRNCHCEQLCCSGCSYAFKFDREASKPRAKTKHTSAKRSILRFARAAQGCCLAFRMVYLFSTSVQPQFAALDVRGVHIISAEPNFFLAREFSQHEQHVSFILTSSILARLEAFGLRTGLRRRNSVFARLERSVYRSEPRQESLTNATNAPRREMSATNDVSQSEDSANSLIDRSSAAASTKKRDAPSATSEDDAASTSDAAPDAPNASQDAKRRRVEDPARVARGWGGGSRHPSLR